MTESLWAVAAVVGGSGLTVATVLALFVKAGLGVLGKSHEQRMEQAHKERLADINHAHDERMAALQLGHQRELERFKTDLAVAAHEAQARSTALVTKQAEIVAKMHKLLGRSARALGSAGRPEFASEHAVAHAREAQTELLDYYHDHSIWLPTDVDMLVCKYVVLLRAVESHVAREELTDPVLERELGVFASKEEARKGLAAMGPKVEKSLERVFRGLLGVDASEAPKAQQEGGSDA